MLKKHERFSINRECTDKKKINSLLQDCQNSLSFFQDNRGQSNFKRKIEEDREQENN